MLSLLKRLIQVTAGLVCFSAGVYLAIQANIGLEPWSALDFGISLKTGLSYGTISVILSIIILAIDLTLGEKLGLGTIIDAVVVGACVDLFTAFGLVPLMTRFVPGVLVLLAGQVLISVGSYFYIRSALGCGPRDALMIALGKRMPKAPIGLVRGVMEGAVLFIGWLLGAKVGLGTVIAVFGIGFILQATFRVFRFDAKAVAHEDAVTSIKNALAEATKKRAPKTDARNDSQERTSCAETEG